MKLRMPGIYKPKSSQFWWFRLTVPADIRAKFGKREIKMSLDTSDFALAQIYAAEAQATHRAEFVRLRAENASEDAARGSQMVDDGLAAFVEANGHIDNVIYAMSKFIAFRMMAAWGQDDYRHSGADRAFGLGAEHVDPDESPDGALVPDSERSGLAERTRFLETNHSTGGVGYRIAVRRVLEARAWNFVEPEILALAGRVKVDIVVGSDRYNSAAERLLNRIVNHRSRHESPHLAGLDVLLGSTLGTDVPAQYTPASAPAIAPGVVVDSPKSNFNARISAGFGHWVKMQAPRAHTVHECKRSVDRFISLHGDMPVGQITRDHVLDFREALMHLPRNVKLAKMHASGQTLRSILTDARGEEKNADRNESAATGRGVNQLSPGTIKKDIGALSAILACLMDERWIASNPASNIKVAGYSKTRKGQVSPRLSFTESMLETLFSSPMYTGGMGPTDIERTRPGPYVYQDELYWSFLIAVTVGNRIEELGQSKLSDVQTVSAGRRGDLEGEQITFILISGTGINESIKTDTSFRPVVVHPNIIELGFNDYVKERRAAGKEMLFDLSMNPLDKWTKGLSRRANLYIDRVITDDPRYVFHSMRHGFKDLAEESDMSDRTSDRISGHAGSSSSRNYGVGASVRHDYKGLKLLDLSFIDWIALKNAVKNNRQIH